MKINDSPTYYHRLLKKLAELNNQQMARQQGSASVINSAYQFNRERLVFLRDKAQQQAQWIRSLYTLPERVELLSQSNASGASSFLRKDLNIVGKALKRRVGAQLPTDMLVQVQQASGYGTDIYAQVQSPHHDSTGRIRGYTVRKLGMGMSNPGTLGTRYNDKIRVYYGMLLEFEALAAAAASLADTDGTVPMETFMDKFSDFFVGSIVDPNETAEFKRQVLMFYKARMMTGSGFDVNYGYHEGQAGARVGGMIYWLSSLLRDIPLNVQEPEPPRRDYFRMIELCKLHGRQISKHGQWRMIDTLTGAPYAVLPDKAILRHAPLREDVYHPRSIFMIGFKTYRTRYKRFVQAVKKIRHLHEAQRYSEVNALLKSDQFRTDVAEVYGFYRSCAQMNHRGVLPLASFLQRYCGYGVPEVGNPDTEKFYMLTPEYIACTANTVQVVTNTDARSGMPVRTGRYPLERAQQIARMYEGRWYLNETMYLWSDGSYKPMMEPPAIGDYHSSRHVVGFLPTQYRAPYMGIELEIGLKSAYDNSDAKKTLAAKDVVKAVNRSTDTKLYAACERDGSVGYGFEIVTGHTGLDTHAERLTDLIPVLDTHYQQSDACGLHIHICKAGTSLQQQARMDKFVHAEANKSLIRALARREPNNYNRQHPNKNTVGRLTQLARENIRMWLNDQGLDRGNPTTRQRALKARLNQISNRLCDERYDMLNFRNDRTIEFRMFASTKDFTELMAALEFAYNLWYFAKERRNDQLFTPQFLSFINDRTRRKETKHLRKFLASKGFAVYQPNPNKHATTVAA